MATEKRVLCPERARKIPRSFSWIDHRLVRDGYIGRCGHEALALYLFLVAVGDAEGLSYYSDAKTARLLAMSETVLGSARNELIRAGLIAYRRPLCQVLGLDRENSRSSDLPAPNPPSGATLSVGDVLRRAMASGSEGGGR